MNAWQSVRLKMSCWVAHRKAIVFLSQKGDTGDRRGYGSTRMKQKNTTRCISGRKQTSPHFKSIRIIHYFMCVLFRPTTMEVYPFLAISQNVLLFFRTYLLRRAIAQKLCSAVEIILEMNVRCGCCRPTRPTRWGSLYQGRGRKPTSGYSRVSRECCVRGLETLRPLDYL